MAKQKKKKLPPVNPKPAAKVDEALRVILKPRPPPSRAAADMAGSSPIPSRAIPQTGVYVAALFILACAQVRLAAWGLRKIDPAKSRW
jgi:hypothetical protein